MRKVKLFFDKDYFEEDVCKFLSAEEQLNDFIIKNKYNIVDVKLHICNDANTTTILLLIYNDNDRKPFEKQ